ncbi:MAG: hypothetical protein OEZ47_09995, partial [Gammaproteobacteria bacterium]|nr:hypothetical protein [Gammaproteobacteria bacterium]
MSNSNWSLVCHTNHGDTGELCIIRPIGDKHEVTTIPVSDSSGKDEFSRPVFLGVNAQDQVILMDPISKTI